MRQGGEELVLAAIGVGERRRPQLKLFEQARALRGKLLDPDLLLGHGPPQHDVGDRRLDGVAHAGIGKALDQVVLGALLDRLDRQRFVALPGQHHHGRRLLAELLLQFLQELEAVQVRQVVVEQHAVRALRAAARQAFGAGAGFRNDIGAFVPRFQVAPEGQPVLPAVVDDQDAARRRAHCTSRMTTSNHHSLKRWMVCMKSGTLDRLAHVAGSAGLVAAADIARVGGGRQDDHRNVLQASDRA